MRANIDYSLDTQGEATRGQDNAEQSLFTSVSYDAQKKPTFKGKCRLLSGFRNQKCFRANLIGNINCLERNAASNKETRDRCNEAVN